MSLFFAHKNWGKALTTSITRIANIFRKSNQNSKNYSSCLKIVVDIHSVGLFKLYLFVKLVVK